MHVICKYTKSYSGILLAVQIIAKKEGIIFTQRRKITMECMEKRKIVPFDEYIL